MSALSVPGVLSVHGVLGVQSTAATLAQQPLATCTWAVRLRAS